MLRLRLIFPAAGLVLLLSLILTGLGIWAGNAIVSAMSSQLIGQMTDAVRREVGDMMMFGERLSARMVNSITRHDIPFDDPVALRRELYGLTREEPNVRWLACGNEAGGMTDAGRLPDGTIVFLTTDDFRAGVYRSYEASPDGQLGRQLRSGVHFDTREAPWYKIAKDTRAPYWTEPFLGSVERLLGVALTAPIFDKNGSFVGVCNVRLIFTALSDWMNTLRIGDNGRSFVIDTTGHLIAASGGVSPVKIDAEGKHVRLRATEAPDSIVRETASQLGRQAEIAGSSTGPHVFSFDAPTLGRVYAAVDRYEAPGGIKLTIASAVPVSDFLGPVYRAAYLSIGSGAAIVAAFVVLGGWMIGRTLRPLTTLAQAAQAIERGEWRDVPAFRRKDEVGQLAQAFTLMTTHLKETLDGLRRSEAKLEEAQRVAHVGYWEHDLDADHLTWSNETYRIFGLPPRGGTITVAEVTERVHPEDRPALRQAVAEAERGAARYETEYRVVRPDGEVRVVHSQGDLIKDASGRPRVLFGTIQDITDRKQAEEAARESERRYREAQLELAHASRVATMGQLAASIAHEVNQPIAGAVISAQTILRSLEHTSPDLERVRRAADRIARDCMRAADIIGRTRAMVKKAPARQDKLDMNEVLVEITGLTSGETSKNGILVRRRLSEGLPQIRGDRVQLQQVIVNLIMNAVEAMSQMSDGPRELLISTEPEPGGVLVAVRDSGPGLAEAGLERMFEAFYTTKESGLGMGLSISRSIIEAHGGRLWASVHKPRGTVFQFNVPAATTETVPGEQAGSMPVS